MKELYLNKTWGCDVEIVAYTDAQRVRVIVHIPYKPYKQVFGEKNWETEVHISFHNGNHYNALVQTKKRIRKVSAKP